jgi:hypothetical protein
LVMRTSIGRGATLTDTSSRTSRARPGQVCRIRRTVRLITTVPR